MDNNYSIDCSGIFIAILSIVFITLKLTGAIDWPWIWVLSPIWLTMLFIIFVVLLVVTLGYLVAKYGERSL